MFLVPDVPEVTDFVTAQEDVFGCRTCTITVELPRGKRTSEENAVLVDATWDQVSSFTRWSPLRGDEVETVHRFYVGQSAGRPSAEAVMAAADAWIHDAMDDDTAGDYVTGDSGLEGFAEPPDSAAPPHGGTVEQDAVLQMQQRILELETRWGLSKAVPLSMLLQRLVVCSCFLLRLDQRMLRCFKDCEHWQVLGQDVLALTNVLLAQNGRRWRSTMLCKRRCWGLQRRTSCTELWLLRWKRCRILCSAFWYYRRSS
jgi:hypothetical protein